MRACCKIKQGINSCVNCCIKIWSCSRALEGGGWGGLSSPIFSQPLHRNFEPPFILLPFQKLITTVHPIALQRWFMASLVTRFFPSLIRSNQRTNFCNFVIKVNKIAKTANFLVTSCTKLLEHYCIVAVKFSPGADLGGGMLGMHPPHQPFSTMLWMNKIFS